MSRCYVHDAQENTLTLESVTRVASLPVQLHAADKTTLLDTRYEKLLQLEFVSAHKETGKRSTSRFSPALRDHFAACRFRFAIRAQLVVSGDLEPCSGKPGHDNPDARLPLTSHRPALSGTTEISTLDGYSFDR